MTSGCGGLSNTEKNTYYQKAIPIGQEYFKKYYNVEVEFTEFYINIPISSTMVLKGHLENDPYTKVSLYYDFPSLKFSVKLSYIISYTLKLLRFKRGSFFHTANKSLLSFFILPVTFCISDSVILYVRGESLGTSISTDHHGCAERRKR